MTAVVVSSVLLSAISKNITNCDYHYKFETFDRIIAMLLKSHLKGLAKVKPTNMKQTLTVCSELTAVDTCV